ncbi:MAG: hypothetical protein Kow00124_25700 [Anaerolineae bacterium]
MFRKRVLAAGLALAASLLLTGAVLAATIDSTNRTVSTSTLFIDFSDTNPEEISFISWNGSANLTATGVTHCGDPLEYFGNSWAAPDSAAFVSLVGWGQLGTWSSPNSKTVQIDSSSASASGCYGSLDIPVETRYRFWDRGPTANRIRVHRTFDFRMTALARDFRPYIPRLYPLDGFTEVYHPDASGTTLVTETPALCPFGCQVSDWDDTWFAVHNPTTGVGLIVRHAPSPYDVDLWVDEDGASYTNATGVLLLQPAGGFTDRVTDVQFLCFYDSTIWTPSLTLPPGC